MSAETGMGAVAPPASTMLDLWRLLANAGPKAAAEALTAPELARLHIPTALDDFIVDRVRDGWSIVLTGNAGDGLTNPLIFF